ncbi:hypothetical protein Lalb_Chr05g0229151 [Lupinus albus]|uniref:Uncharacterized protein n=1 Tax=Lupinus albus TaxID=3870 RepID=A0A6A4QKN8_LUPAL|nr:hypothetical protein Lalb_Chr05g0229151 [Lupinus albus]
MLHIWKILLPCCNWRFCNQACLTNLEFRKRFQLRQLLFSVIFGCKNRHNDIQVIQLDGYGRNTLA